MFGLKKKSSEGVEEKMELVDSVEEKRTKKNIKLEESWEKVYLGTEIGDEAFTLAEKKLTELGYFTRLEVRAKKRHEEAEVLAKVAKTEEEWSSIILKSSMGSDIFNLAVKEKKVFEDERLNKSKLEVNLLVRELLAEEE